VWFHLFFAGNALEIDNAAPMLSQNQDDPADFEATETGLDKTA
jgi:hypothetical protein